MKYDYKDIKKTFLQKVKQHRPAPLYPTMYYHCRNFYNFFGYRSLNSVILLFVFILIHNIYIQFILPIYVIKLLQLECISYRTGFSLQAAAILLINEIHEITFLVVNGISYTLLMESTTNFVLVGPIHIRMTSKEPDGRQETT